MKKVQEGDEVRVHYTGKLEDGTVFDTSKEREPLQFKVGSGQMIKGFDEAVKGMEVGEAKTAKLSSEEAYGERNDQMIVTLTKDKFPEDIKPEVGQQLSMQSQEGQPIPVVVTDIKNDEVTLDANHPLAGKDLIFEIEVVEVV
ncbi:MAG: FKBP-type peptidyl-prolyl cis-trans isomerase [Candidatus Cyclobacteriaceae bacterium M2_1C_046]